MKTLTLSEDLASYMIDDSFLPKGCLYRTDPSLNFTKEISLSEMRHTFQLDKFLLHPCYMCQVDCDAREVELHDEQNKYITVIEK